MPVPVFDTPDRWYFKLSDPRGAITNRHLRFPAEPALGGHLGPEERAALLAAFDESICRDTGFRAESTVRSLEAAFEVYCGLPHAVATNGAGTATDLILRSLALSPTCEVLSGAMNFHGQHLAVLGVGAKLVLYDVRADGSPDLDDLESRMTGATRAVLVTSLHGEPLDRAKIVHRLRTRGARLGIAPLLIEDAARSLGGPLTCADDYPTAVIFSLHSKKVATALGEGGMAVTNSAALSEDISRMRAFGDRVSWGSNFKMPKLNAAVGRVQMDRLPELIRARRAAAERRTNTLRDSSEFRKGLFALPASQFENHSYCYFPIVLAQEFGRHERDAVMEFLATQASVGSVVANPPTYQYNSWIRERVECRNQQSEAEADRLLCVSFHPYYSDEEDEHICRAFLKALNQAITRRSSSALGQGAS